MPMITIPDDQAPASDGNSEVSITENNRNSRFLDTGIKRDLDTDMPDITQDIPKEFKEIAYSTISTVTVNTSMNFNSIGETPEAVFQYLWKQLSERVRNLFAPGKLLINGNREFVRSEIAVVLSRHIQDMARRPQTV